MIYHYLIKHILIFRQILPTSTVRNTWRTTRRIYTLIFALFMGWTETVSYRLPFFASEYSSSTSQKWRPISSKSPTWKCLPFSLINAKFCHQFNSCNVADNVLLPWKFLALAINLRNCFGKSRKFSGMYGYLRQPSEVLEWSLLSFHSGQTQKTDATSSSQYIETFIIKIKN